MKIAVVCLMVVLTRSCHEVVDNPTRAYSSTTPERREEVRKIISSYLDNTGIDVVRGPLTVKEVQKELAEDGSRLEEVPGWREELKSKLKRGDELYYYKTDRESWRELRGEKGYVAIRGNEVIGSLVTLIN